MEAFRTIANQKQEISELRKHKESSKPSAVKTVEMNISHIDAFRSKKNESQSVVQETQYNYPPHYPSAAASQATAQEVKQPATSRKISSYSRHYVVPKTSCIKPQGEVKCPVIKKEMTKPSTYHLPYLYTRSRTITNQGGMKCPSTEKKIAKVSTYHSQHLHSSIGDKIRQAEVICQTITKERTETALYHPNCRHPNTNNIMLQGKTKCPVIRKDTH